MTRDGPSQKQPIPSKASPATNKAAAAPKVKSEKAAPKPSTGSICSTSAEALASTATDVTIEPDVEEETAPEAHKALNETIANSKADQPLPSETLPSIQASDPIVEDADAEKEIPEHKSTGDHAGERAAAEQISAPATATKEPEAVGVPETASVDVSPPADETAIAAPSKVVDPSIKEENVAEESSVQEPASSVPASSETLATAEGTDVPADVSEDVPLESAEVSASRATPTAAEEKIEKTASDSNVGDMKEISGELDEDGVD